MARRTMILRRIDPWSVLKFGFVVNVCVAVVFVLGFVILWFVIGQLGIIEQACQLAEDVGFEDCGVDGGALFRVVLLFAALAAVIMTGIAVFGAFLHNLLAELIGGIELTLTEEGGGAFVRRSDGGAAATTARSDRARSQAGRSGENLGQPPPRSDETRSGPPRQGQGASSGGQASGGRPTAGGQASDGGSGTSQGDAEGGSGGHDDEDAIFGRRE